MRLIAFGVCVALLAVGRVALSFAVVQKSLETSSVIKQERALRDDTMSLSALVAQQSAGARVQNLATDKYGLVPAGDQVFLRVHASAASSAAPAP